MNYAYWLALSYAEYISNKEKYCLVKEFGSAEEIFRASYTRIKNSEIIRPHKIDRLVGTVVDANKQYDLRKRGIKLCCINDDDYPLTLKNIFAPPILLYYRGTLPHKPCIAVVGSRKTTETGRRNAFDVAKVLAGKGFCVASGLARGIDSCAHLGALEKGVTAAVLGNGLDTCYPSENRLLMERIEKCGCVISEFRPDKKPSKYTFPARNRIISGLSEAVIVVEAAAKSGALITADFALDQGREVFVFKNIPSEYSKGSETLIAEGAMPIKNINEFIAAFT